MESFSFYLVVLLLIPSAVRLEVPRYLQAKYGNNVTGASPSPRYNPGVKTKTKSASAHGPSAHSGTRFRGGTYLWINFYHNLAPKWQHIEEIVV
jgi:hypothetical protein